MQSGVTGSGAGELEDCKTIERGLIWPVILTRWGREVTFKDSKTA